MVRRETGRMPNFFDLIFYKTIGEQPFSSTMSSSAVVKLRVGDRVTVEVSPAMKYQVEVRAIEKGSDDASLDISAY